MHSENGNANDGGDAGVGKVAGLVEIAQAKGFYTVECRGPDGELKWTDTISNLITTVGKNFILDTVLAGSSYTAAWYVGLVNGSSTPTYNAADTMTSHAGWTEVTAYSQSTRVAPSFSSASAGSKATSSAAAFSINANGTIVAGMFLNSVSTKSGTTGTLLSVGSFTGGNKTVDSGDTLNVSYTLSV